jgi:uncharacterized Tic20 family protein
VEENTRKEENNWAGGVHVAAFILAVFTSWSAGIGGMVAAFIVWLMKKDESPFIRKHAAEAFNFNFSMFIYALISVILFFMTLGLGIIFLIPIGLVLAVVWLWCTVQAAIAGFDGKEYRYPISFRLMH